MDGKSRIDFVTFLPHNPVVKVTTDSKTKVSLNIEISID